MSENDSLQFERAEFDSARSTVQCDACTNPLVSSYFDVNGRMVCEGCRYAIESQATAGSSLGRFTRAAGAGFGAAIAGALLYYAVGALTGYEVGLIAIAVGYGVGKAVNWGSNGRGGWRYQTLAILLTYFAIVSTYIPPLLEGMRAAQAEDGSAATSPTDAGTAPATSAATTATQTPADGSDNTPTAGGLVLAGVFLLVIAAAAPFLAGFQNIIGVIIIGIGLYEAWKLNRKVPLVITGPLVLGRPQTEVVGA